MKKKTLFVCLGVLCLAAPGWAAEVVLRETACRLFDSRNIGGAGLGPKISTATLETRGDAGSTQGGQSDCGVPDTATGVVVNIVAFDPLGPGWGRLWPYGATEPLSTNINSTGALNESTGILATLGTDGKLSWHSSFTGHLVVDLAGWLEPCIPDETFELTYSASDGAISVPETGDIDLLKYARTGAIWVGGGASQPGRYLITGSGISNGRQRLYVSPSPETATDAGLEVHLLSGSCSPREVLLDGFTG